MLLAVAVDLAAEALLDELPEDELADALVVPAVKTYCRAHFHSPADYDKLLSAYEEQKGHLMNCTGYTVFPTEVIPDGEG